MIEYDLDYWQVRFIFQLRGSIIAKASSWAIPSTALALILHYYGRRDVDLNMSQFSSYNFVLGFLVIFRCQQAYSRFWEAGTIIQRVRGNWFNAISACFAFCSPAPEDEQAVLKFKHTLIRLGSLLYAAALQQIGICDDEHFEIIDVEGFNEASLKYLGESSDKALVVLQWMQQLIMKAQASGVLKVPPPILSRVFQELSNGIVGIVDAQKITDIIFPFPLAQLVSMMLIAASVISPITLSFVMTSPIWCGVLNFITVFCFFGINFIAAEIEMPFGDDPNDLPLHSLQICLNSSLIQLLDTHMCTCPEFELTETSLYCTTYPCPDYLTSAEQHKVFAESRATTRPMYHFLTRLSFGSARQSVRQQKTSLRRAQDSRKSQKAPVDEPGVLKGRDTKSVAHAESTISVPGVGDQEAHVSTSLDRPEVAQNGLLQELPAESDKPSQGLDLSQTQNHLAAQLQAHSAKMDKHFSILSGLLNEHLSFMVQDLDAIFASYRKATLDFHIADMLRERGECNIPIDDEHQWPRVSAGDTKRHSFV
eukprot:TRINITY_DN59818_c0_g1_i1.p1 TRINITY_DN59818_c0_g1~~TRINITY_DN59818_c0_g1_i1.p1  ORF type:complete len:537 (+),score=70.33 TRINITY_DN59818_c0_g1_i1:85-1695(+)